VRKIFAVAAAVACLATPLAAVLVGAESATSISPNLVHPVTVTIVRDLNGAGASGTVTSNPAGLDCPGTCATDFEYASPLTLTATPLNGGTFDGWSGITCDEGQTSATCSFIVPSVPDDIHASFTAAPPVHVTVGMDAVDPGAFGSITSSPAGIDCGTTCEADFPQGSELTLTAHPAAGAGVGSWDAGPCLGSTKTVCKFTVPSTPVIAGIHWALAPVATPTAKPTATPRPTPTQRVETAPPETFVPGSPTPAPATTEPAASASEAPTDSPTAAPLATPTPTAGPTTPAADSGGGSLLPLLAIAAALAIATVVGGLVVSRRRPGGAPPPTG